MKLPNRSSIAAITNQQVSTNGESNESTLPYTPSLKEEENPNADTEPSSEIRPSPKPRPGQGFGPSKREIMQLDSNGDPIKVNKKDLNAEELVKSLKLTSKGYRTMSNRMIEILYKADFSKAELEIILFIIRESIFWQREWTKPMSGADFELKSGTSRSSLWSHLKRLTDQNWIEKSLTMPIVPGRKQFCNQYRLNPLVWGPLFPERTIKNEQPDGQTEPGQNTELNQKSSTKPDLNFKTGIQSESQTTSSLYKKNLLKKDLKTSLSQSPKELETRWFKMADQGKYERRIFSNLFKTFGQPVWDHCAEVVQYLVDHGDVRQRQVASPFGLLSQGNNWELFLGLALKRKQNEEALKEARQAPALVDQVVQESTEEFTSPPEGFTPFSKSRSYEISRTPFQGPFNTMEEAFKIKFGTHNEQWSEISTQLGSLGDSIDNDRAKWIAGVQRWFHGAWNLGQIAHIA